MTTKDQSESDSNSEESTHSSDSKEEIIEFTKGNTGYDRSTF